MTDVETHSYEGGSVAAETVIKLEDTEFVVTETVGQDEHDVYERDPGEEHPHTQVAPEHRSIPPRDED